MKRLTVAALICAGAALGEEPKAMPAAVEPLTPLPLAAPVAGEADALRHAIPGTPAALPPVTAQLFQIKGRVELWRMVAVSLGDAFYRMLAVGARGEFHLSERWSVGGHGLFGTSMASAPVAVCNGGPCDQPVSDQLRSAP